MKSFDSNGFSNNITVEKANLTRLDISKLPTKLPEFKNSRVTKDILVAAWLENWIKSGLATGKLKPQQLLPKKDEIAEYIGISTGTVQNAIRYIEDAGLVESKQRIGTMIKDQTNVENTIRKQSSKRDSAILAIKKYIIDKGLKVGQNLPSSRDIAKAIGSAPNTTRLALEYLSSNGIIKAMGNRGNKANWMLANIPTDLSEKTCISDIKSVTLVNKVEKDLIHYIDNNFIVGDKLPAHIDLAVNLKVSIKTIHDAVKKLIKSGLLTSKRGRYGTTVVKLPSDKNTEKLENKIFASAEDAAFYSYEKIEQHLRDMISKEYAIGDKLPSMSDLAKQLDVSANTIRKALQNLSKDCIVESTRGKYGGTFVANLPKEKDIKPKFTWLSVNKDLIKAYRTPESTK